ncbi:MAG: nucleotide exchange factor GrpE [Pelagibacteraceae bacterium TMED287]|nr:MAG: nucleotide exchange factor GrpE [Pelagibacteraceae bacterium TMED287]|tara:strand:- start:6 stop:593 length:588 start_codon:yes stop_codon:yes gene_type:complete
METKNDKNNPGNELKKNHASSKKEENKAKKDQTVEDKLKETEEKLLRTLAELENQRRRFEKETKEAFEFGGFNFAREILSLLDNLQRAQTSLKNDEVLKKSKDLEKFLKNIEIIEKDLVSIFEKNGIKRIKCLKEKFDPNLHQAMLEVENEEEKPGTVMQEMQPGYMFGERLLRPSFVAVSKKKLVIDEQKDLKK